jgi:GT2 family glycosyltransferase
VNEAAAAVNPAAAIAAVGVAADSGVVLERCVALLLQNPDVAAVRLVDNASRDGVPQCVADRHKNDARLQVLTNTTNRGFGAAVNQATHGLDADWLAIVNPDCLPIPTALSALLSIARAHTDAGLLGVLVCDESGHVDPASRRRDPLLRRALASLGLTHGETVNAMEAPPGAGGVEDVEAVSGALMLVRRTLFEQLGGLDEGYFLHFEDLDLCRRVRDAGYRVLLAADVRVVHAGGSSSRHRPVFVDWHKHRGMWRWFRKFDPAARNVFLRTLVWCGIWTHFIAVLPVTAWRGVRSRAATRDGNLS